MEINGNDENGFPILKMFSKKVFWISSTQKRKSNLSRK